MRARTWHSALAAIPLAAVVLATAPPPGAAAQGYEAVVVQADPRGAVVAVTIRYPVGSAMDPPGEEGTAYLLGRALEGEAERRLRGHASRVELSVAGDELSVTLLSPPERWIEGFRELEQILQALPVPEAEIRALLDRHRERLVFEEGAPVRSFEQERRLLLLGAAHPGARDGLGTPGSLERISAGGVTRFQSEHLRRGGAVVAVVGPVSEDEVERVVAGPLRSVSPVDPFDEPSSSPAPAAGGPESPPGVADGAADSTAGAVQLPPPPRLRLRDGGPASPRVPAGPTAWSAPDRITVDRELTSTWMAVAWPYPEGTSRFLLEFLGRTLRETVVPSPPDPGFYSADVEVVEVDGRPVLVFSATVDPRVAGRWEERILQGMATVADSPPAGAFFELGRRRFRNSVLLPMAAPEGRSRWLAVSLAREGAIPDPEIELWRIDREALAAAADAAGPPRVLLYGPLGMMEASRP